MAINVRSLCTLVLLALSLTGQTAMPETLGALTSVQFVGDVPIANQIDSARVLGVKRVRLAVRWYEVERVRGSMNWQLTDSRIMAVERAGFTPIITLFGSNVAYPPGAEASGWTSEAIAGFARFSAATVARYGTKGRLVRSGMKSGTSQTPKHSGADRQTPKFMPRLRSMRARRSRRRRRQQACLPLAWKAGQLRIRISFRLTISISISNGRLARRRRICCTALMD